MILFTSEEFRDLGMFLERIVEEIVIRLYHLEPSHHFILKTWFAYLGIGKFAVYRKTARAKKPDVFPVLRESLGYGFQ